MNDTERSPQGPSPDDGPDSQTDSPARLDPEPSGYADAVAELDEILVEIEGADVDVDVLAERVARASLLVKWCRARIVAARDAVEEHTID